MQTIFRYGPTTLPELYRKASRSMEMPFLITETSVSTRGDILGRAGSYAQLFAASGIEANSRVALTLEDGPDWVAAFLALTSLGATAVLAHGVNASQQIADSGCTAIVGPQIGDTNVKIIFDSQVLQAGRSSPSPLVASDIDPNQEACIAFTSGSSGQPKGAILTHRGLTTGLMNMMLGGALIARSPSPPQPKAAPLLPTVLLRTPLAHVSGYMQILLMLMIGGTIIKSNIDLHTLASRHRLSSIIGVTDDDIRTIQTGSEASIGQLRSIAVVGRALPSTTRRAIRDAYPHLGIGAGYGLTEANGLVSAAGNVDVDIAGRSVGPVFPTVECRITHNNGESCATGEAGQIWLRGAMLMRGYCNAPDHSMPDGWFATGDMGYLADDGALNVLDRRERLVRSGGSRISCREIEDAAREIADGISIVALSLPNQGDDDQLVIFAETRSKDLSGLKASLMERFPITPIYQATFIAMGAVAADVFRKAGVRPPPRTGGIVGMSETQEKLNGILDEVRQETGVPGLALCIERAGSRWFSSSGTSRVGMDEPLARHVRFDVSCLMKFFLSVTALKLAAQDKLDLHEDVTSFLPELGDRREISLMHLMSHTSGYHGVDITDMNVRWASKWQAFTSNFRHTGQLFAPGTTFNYEHTEHVILGEAIRTQFGKTPSQLVHDTLLSSADVQLQDATSGSAGISAHGFSAQRGQYVPSKLPPFSSFWEASLPAMTITLDEVLSSVRAAFTDDTIGSVLYEPRISLPDMARSEKRAELPPQKFTAACAIYEGGVLGHNGSMFGQTVGFRYDRGSGTIATAGVNAYSAHARDTALRRALNLFTDRQEQPSSWSDQRPLHSREDIFGNLAPDDAIGRYVGSYLGQVGIEQDGADLRVTVGPDGKRQSTFRIVQEGTGYTIASRMPVAIRFQMTHGRRRFS